MELENFVTIPLNPNLTREQAEEQCDMLYRLYRNIDKFIELNKLIDEFNLLAPDYFGSPVHYLTLEEDIQNGIDALAKEIKLFKEYKEQQEMLDTESY